MRPLESFEYWCRQALIWLELAGPEDGTRSWQIAMNGYARCIRNAEGYL